MKFIRVKLYMKDIDIDMNLILNLEMNLKKMVLL